MWMVRFALMLCLLSIIVWGFTYSFVTTELIMIPFLLIVLVATIIRTEMALVKYADSIESGHA